MRQNNYQNLAVPYDTYGKNIPSNRKLEANLLGACMLFEDVWRIVADRLQPNMFYDPYHEIVFDAICHVGKSVRVPEYSLVIERLMQVAKLEQIGGAHFVTNLSQNTTQLSNIEEVTSVIYRYYCQREIIKIARSIQDYCYEVPSMQDLTAMLDAQSDAFMNLLSNALRESMHSYKQITSKIISEIDEPVPEHGLTGVPSGFRAVDRRTGGWQPTDFIIIAGRPGMGKSAFAARAGLNAAKLFNIPVGFWSLEMSSKQTVMRLLAGELEIPLRNILHRSYEPHQRQLMQQYEFLDNVDFPFYLDDTPNQTVNTLSISIRKAVKEKGIGLAIIDYLQLIGLLREDSKREGTRDQDIGVMTRKLKQLAKEVNIPIIALSQLSRAVDTRDNNEPRLSDLRESGNIEQDADAVFFIHRPAYYDLQKNPLQILDPIFEKETRIKCAKLRNGSPGVDIIYWLKDFATFVDPDAFGYLTDSPF